MPTAIRNNSPRRGVEREKTRKIVVHTRTRKIDKIKKKIIMYRRCWSRWLYCNQIWCGNSSILWQNSYLFTSLNLFSNSLLFFSSLLYSIIFDGNGFLHSFLRLLLHGLLIFKIPQSFFGNFHYSSLIFQ